MARYTCWVCGCGYDGLNCSVCALKKQAEETARRTARNQERATSAMREAVAEQTERLAEEFERSRQAAEEAALENQMAIAEAVEEQRVALAHAAEEHERITANAWKLQSQAKSEQAYSLFRSGMLEEALHLALEAIKQDPSNMDGVFVAGASLKRQGKTKEARPYFEKQVQMLSLPSYREEMKYYFQVFTAIETEDYLIETFCTSLANNINSWSQCNSIDQAESFAYSLIERQQNRSAILVQQWVLWSWGATSETLVSTRKLIHTLSRRSSGLGPQRLEIEQLIAWLESPKTKAKAGIFYGTNDGMSLPAMTYALEFASLLGIERDTVSAFFEKLRIEERSGFEKDFLLLRQLSNRGDLDPRAFSLILDAATQKYISWAPGLQEQVYREVTTEVERLPKHNLGCLSGCVWFVLLIVSGSAFPILIGVGAIPMSPSFPLGVVLGTVLFAAMSGHVISSFRRNKEMHERLASAMKRQNTEFDQLGLPQLLTPKLKNRSTKVDFAVCTAVALAFFIGWQLIILGSRGTTSTSNGAAQLYNGTGIEDDLAGRSVGNAYGIHWTSAISNRGAIFRAADSSRIEYPSAIPSEGTLEFWIRIESGYEYSNYVFRPNLDHAHVFSTDVPGGDETWPGTMKLTLSKNGDISLWMATSKYNRPPAAPTVAHGTSFRFGQWHAVGISYGGHGQSIMLDGKIVASVTTRTQRLGGAGTDASPLDLPTIGETVSHAWQPHRYNGGFEGTVAGFRASATQQDWRLAKGINNNASTASMNVTSGLISEEDQHEHQLVQQAQQLFTEGKYDASLAACNEALILNSGDQIALQLKSQIQSAMQPANASASESARPQRATPNELAITEMVSQWAAAHAANDVGAEIAFYAPEVDPFYDHHNVPREFVLQTRQNLLNKGVRLSRYEASNITVTMNGSGEATVNLVKLWSTRPVGSMPIHTQSQLHVRSLNGKWLITGEKDF